MSCNKILQLYGFKSEEQFKTQFNKKMSGGIKQNGTVTNLVWRSNASNIRFNRTSNIASNGFGINNCFIYPITIYGSLINGLAPTRSGSRT